MDDVTADTTPRKIEGSEQLKSDYEPFELIINIQYISLNIKILIISRRIE